MLKNLFLFLFTILFLTNVNAQPINTKLYTNTLDAKVGDTIVLQLKVNPTYERPVFSVSANLIYNPNFLEFQEASFSENVNIFHLTKPPYYLTDTVSGMIRRTAGYPNGAYELSEFTTYTFKAISPGKASIFVEDGIALDELNNNIGLQQKELTINVSEDIVEADALSPLPKTLEIDMSLEILGPIAIYKEDEYVFPIDRKYFTPDEGSTFRIYVYNEKSELFYSEEIENNPEEPIVFSIPPNTLNVGNYVISVENIDVDGNSKIVAQKSIGVLSNNLTWFSKNRDILLPLFLIFVVVAIIHHLAVDRDLYFKIAELRKARKNKVKNR